MAAGPLISGAPSQQQDTDGQAVGAVRMTQVCRHSLGGTVPQNLYPAGTDGQQPLSSQHVRLLQCMRVDGHQLTGRPRSKGGLVSTAQRSQSIPPTRTTDPLRIAPQADGPGQATRPLKERVGRRAKSALQPLTLLRRTRADPLMFGSSTIRSQQEVTVSRVIAQKLPLKLHAVNTGLQAVDTGLKQLAMAGKVIVMGQGDGHRREGQTQRILCPEDKKRDGGTGVATRLVLVSMETQHTV